MVVIKLLGDVGIHLNGDQDFDPQVKNNRFYSFIFAYAFSGFEFAYQKSFFECQDLCKLMQKINRSKLGKILLYHPSVILPSLITYYFYVLPDEEAYEYTGKAYDTGFTDTLKDQNKCVPLSTGIWDGVETVQEAYEKKLQIVASKLKLRIGMRVLDIGCGEGGLCHFIAANNDVSVVGINISKLQVERAKQLCSGLNVKVEQKHMMLITGTYDRIICLGVAEVLGSGKFRRFFEIVHSCLADDGLFLLEVFTARNFPLPVKDKCMTSLFGELSLPYTIDLIDSAKNLFVIEEWENLSKHEFRTSIERVKMLKRKENEDECERATEFFFAWQAASIDSNLFQVYRIIFSKI
ncbi:cyclopropane-fatty-acyl-phospholipid synthase-like protein [Dinothrombium tinctorium]|uniref:Cyclopropane-fatty-acyl-phospholipid synthase-like protein n=1 Tax=Dinothrombium tinctorium TaxID=1965070 RepID=A0A3S3PZV2_9ACAR|nr:cyclopropane-fatty-acyl-phospholipid synthase-like protein [Dinothrombium tinctorium]RWS00820.1 cyclopropane-fatty-acyl-phospholipid synthase-like protein [Dinothrombium tinctorium]